MIKVLVVDDSAVVRQAIIEILSRDRAIHVMAAVADPLLAIERMKQAWPDVILLDVEMPRMDGITVLRKIMAERPTPVVICSTLTEKGAETTMAALAAGAVSIITKPKLGLKDFLSESTEELIGAVRAASQVNVRRLAARVLAAPVPVPAKLSADAVLPAAYAKKFATDMAVQRIADCIQAMGANGLRADYPLARHLAGAKIAAYTDGSIEMMNERIGVALPQLFK